MQIKSLIIQETEHWIALNKPSGLLSIPDRLGKEVSLKTLLQQVYPNIFVVHRIDKDTSGLIIFAKNEAAHKQLSLQFEHRDTYKEYIALVNGKPLQPEGTIKNFLKEHPAKNGLQVVSRTGKEAISHYKVLENFKQYTYMQFVIDTGRTHQIRVHCKEMGCPIVGDVLYGDGKGILISSLKKKFNLSKNELEEKPILNRLALHAHKLHFTDVDGTKVTIESLLTKDIHATLQQLKKHNI
jgi:23S rRNA pseudouridine1911/1915/1917 synthase